MIRVLEILPGDRAIVSTKGFRRVVILETGEILEELMPEQRAKRFAGYYNDAEPGDLAAALPYVASEE